MKDIVASGILPAGAIQLIVGSAEGLLDHVMSQDVVTFTGSATTGRMLKKHPRIVDESVPFNMEADSLNAIVLGPDAMPGTEAVSYTHLDVYKRQTQTLVSLAVESAAGAYVSRPERRSQPDRRTAP